MQDNLKKAFMKGVCAMNMEAMNIFQVGDEVPSYPQSEATPAKQTMLPFVTPQQLNMNQ